MSPTIIDQDNDALIEITEEEAIKLFPCIRRKVYKKTEVSFEGIPFPDLERTSYEKTFIPNFEL